MKTREITLFVSAVLIGIVVVFIFAKISGQGSGVTAESFSKEAGTIEGKFSNMLTFDTKSTGSMGSGDAVVELTPQIKDGNKLIVHFKANTHSVSLGNLDLLEITTLEYEGKILKPVKADRIGGHHSTSVIVFDVGKEIKNFKIKLYGIPNIQERVYEWNEDKLRSI
jgi:hypothetical protein